VEIENSPPVCLVTGGTSGVGLAILQRLAKCGYQVATCGRDSQRLRIAEATLHDIRPNGLFIQADLAKPADAISLADQTTERFQRIDLLVNNAAVAPLAPFAEISSETFENAIDVNVRSIFYLTQRVWRQMKRQGRGIIINISSLAAVDPFPGFSVYGSTKAWLDLLTVALAAEGKDSGIRVYSIRPGAVETPLLRRLFPDFPGHQCVSPDDVARLACELVLHPEQFQSGQAYNVTNQPSDT
jgi:3-oxoacyl-[acyl-carrier protein] reductase